MYLIADACLWSRWQVTVVESEANRDKITIIRPVSESTAWTTLRAGRAERAEVEKRGRWPG